MEIASVSALSALAGSVVGGFTSGIFTWLSYRVQAHSGELAHDLSRREELFKEFIGATSKLYGDALMSSEPRFDELLGIHGMISRMRVLRSPRTVECAEKLMIFTLDTFFFAPNKTVRELHEMMKSGSGIDPLKEFSEVAREELRSLATTRSTTSLARSPGMRSSVAY